MELVTIDEIEKLDMIKEQIIIKREMDMSIELADNAMLRHRPDLFDEWDFEKNDELGLDVYKVTKGSGKKAHWICGVCTSEYQRSVNKECSLNKCPYCSGSRVNHTNSLASKRPDLTKEWHPNKNGELTPHEVTCGRGIVVWWLGKCGHEWENSVIKRTTRGYKCPYCSSQSLLVGFNDMWSTNPELAKLLADSEDGYRYTESSNQKVNWKCPLCNITTSEKVINSIKREGLSCSSCSDGISYGERMMSAIFDSVGINYDYEKSFVSWGKGKRYDFYLKDLNWIVEIHGNQHYEGVFNSKSRTLEEERENDRLKETLARDNGINEYVIINASKSDSTFILNSLRSSKINDIIELENIDVHKIEEKIATSLVHAACQLWEKGKQVKKISEVLKLSRTTIRKYLKKGKLAKICDYDEEDSRTKHAKRKIVQLSTEGFLIRTWNSVGEASLFHNVSTSTISRCAKGGRPRAAGFKWMYAEEYYQEVDIKND